MHFYKKQAHHAIGKVVDFIDSDNLWIVRTHNQILALDSEHGEIRWEIELANDHLLSYKPMVVLQGKLVYAAHVNGRVGEVRLHGCQIETGVEIWNRPINWSLLNHLGGIHAYGSCILLLDWQTNARKRAMLQLLDPASGDASLEHEIGGSLRPTAIERYGGKTCGVAENTLYLGLRDNTVRQLSIGGDQVKEHRFEFAEFKSLATEKNGAYFSVWSESGQTIIYQDEANGTRQQVVLSPSIKGRPEALIALEPTGEHAQVIVNLAPKCGPIFWKTPK